MKCIRREIIKRYGLHNVLKKLDEEIAEYQSVRKFVEINDDSMAEMADILNVILTVDKSSGGKISTIAQSKMNRMAVRMAVNWYDDNGQKGRV